MEVLSSRQLARFPPTALAGAVPTRGSESATPFTRCRLTTLRWNGSTVETELPCGGAAGRLYVRMSPDSEALTRIWGDPRVRIAPCGQGAGVAGPALDAAARILPEGERQTAVRALGGRGTPALRALNRLRGRGGEDALYVEIVPRELSSRPPQIAPPGAPAPPAPVGGPASRPRS